MSTDISQYALYGCYPKSSCRCPSSGTDFFSSILKSHWSEQAGANMTYYLFLPKNIYKKELSTQFRNLCHLTVQENTLHIYIYIVRYIGNMILRFPYYNLYIKVQQRQSSLRIFTTVCKYESFNFIVVELMRTHICYYNKVTGST